MPALRDMTPPAEPHHSAIATYQDGSSRALHWSEREVPFPDGRLIVGSSDHTVCLLDLETGRVSQRFEGHTNWVSSVAVSPDGRYLLSGGWDGTVRLWNVSKGRQSACFEGHTDQVQGVAFAPDGAHACSVSTDRTVVYWRVLP